MTATPMLEENIFGKYQKRISDSLFLDSKDSEYVLSELKRLGYEVVTEFVNGGWRMNNPDVEFITHEDLGDVND